MAGIVCSEREMSSPIANLAISCHSLGLADVDESPVLYLPAEEETLGEQRKYSGRHRCPIAGREAVQVCSATTHTAPARDARGIAVAHTTPWGRRYGVHVRYSGGTRTRTRANTPPRASTLLAHGRRPLGSPSHQTSQGDGTTGTGTGERRSTADCVWPRRRCTTHQKNSSGA